MAIWRIRGDRLRPVDPTTFPELKVKEEKLRSLLKDRMDAIMPETKLCLEEFSPWENSQRSIDLFGIDHQANLVVVEIKRTDESRGHMELQAIRYAAMISNLTFDQFIKAYGTYMQKHDESNRDYDEYVEEAKEKVLSCLGWNKSDEQPFGQKVKIVLVAPNFNNNPELTAAALWLRAHDIDISCVRVSPYSGNDQEILVDIETVIPLKETEEFQLKYQEKGKEEETRKKAKSWTKTNVIINGEFYESSTIRQMMYNLITGILKSGKTPEDIKSVLPPTYKNQLFEEFDGELSLEDILAKFQAQNTPDDVRRKGERHFAKPGDHLEKFNGRTYVISNQWGGHNIKVTSILKKEFPDLGIEFKEPD